MKITNLGDVALHHAVWLAHDEREAPTLEGKTISATTLLKPVRSLILRERAIEAGDSDTVDVLDIVHPRRGTAIHSAIEKAWCSPKLQETLKKLEVPATIRNRIVVNPTGETKGMFPVYTERRSSKGLNGYTITGECDFIAWGAVRDTKETGAFNYTKMKDSIDDYTIQLSIYRWLMPDLITADIGYLDFIFRSFRKTKGFTKPDVPKQMCETVPVRLLSLEKTQYWIEEKLRLLDYYRNKPEEALPLCTDKELGVSQATYKYYSNPANTRATAVFDDIFEAEARQRSAGGKGKIVTVKSNAFRCLSCPGYTQGTCSQAIGMRARGEL